MQEVSYHLSIGLPAILKRNNKAPWPTLPLQIGAYEINNMKAIESEGNELGKFEFSLMEYHPYDPKSVCKKHCANIHFNWPRGAFSRP